MAKMGMRFFVVFLFLCALPLKSDDAAIVAIKKAYGEAAQSIARAQKGEGGLYCTELDVNRLGGSWRAVGDYSKKAVFWFIDQPEFVAAEGKKREAALAKVEVREKAAALESYREFFYVDGEPAFFFSRKGGGDVDERVYFKGGKALLRLLGKEEAEAGEGEGAILREARYWQELFLLSFGPVPEPAGSAGGEHAIDDWLADCLGKETSTLGTKACLGQAFDKWDAELNQKYRALNSRLDAKAQAALRDAQRAWLAFRDLELAWLAQFYGGLDGSLYGVMLAADRVERVRRRALDLGSLLAVREEE